MKKLCESCEKEFKASYSKARYCSQSCAQKKKKVDKIIKECELMTCRNTFFIYPNSKQILCSRSCQVLWQKINMKGDKNPNYGNRKPNMFKHTDEAKKIIKTKVTESWKKKDRMDKHLEFFKKHRLEDGSMDWHTKEFREKISNSNVDRYLKNGYNDISSKFEKGTYVSRYGIEESYQSSWELIRMKQLDIDKKVKFWTKKHKFIIPYLYRENMRKYIPDFYIEFFNKKIVIEEIKGYIHNVEQFKQKVIFAKKYCMERNIKYIVNFLKHKQNNIELTKWLKKLK